MFNYVTSLGKTALVYPRSITVHHIVVLVYGGNSDFRSALMFFSVGVALLMCYEYACTHLSNVLPSVATTATLLGNIVLSNWLAPGPLFHRFKPSIIIL